jgi:hypothetical protein
MRVERFVEYFIFICSLVSTPHCFRGDKICPPYKGASKKNTKFFYVLATLKEIRVPK